MAELLIVLMMAFNLWTVIYLTWECRKGNKAEGGKEKDCGMKEMSDDVVGKSRSRMVERKLQAAIIESNAATVVQSEAVDEKDVTFADETDTDGGQAPESKTSCQVPDKELDEAFSDNRVSDMVEYDGGEDYDGTPHEANGVTFEDIDLAMRTVKRPKATREEHHHAGMVLYDMKGNELFAPIERNSSTTRRRLNELMDYYLDSVSAVQAKPAPAVIPRKAPAVPDNFGDFNIRDSV